MKTLATTVLALLLTVTYFAQSFSNGTSTGLIYSGYGERQHPKISTVSPLTAFETAELNRTRRAQSEAMQALKLAQVEERDYIDRLIVKYDPYVHQHPGLVSSCSSATSSLACVYPTDDGKWMVK